MSEAKFQLIPLGQLNESPNNHRKSYPPEGMKEITESIKEKGILSPLLVRPIGGDNGSTQYEILSGSRRFRGALEAGLTEAPAIVRSLDDRLALEVMIIDNIIRDNPHPLEEAEGYRDLVEKHGYTPETIAAKVGKSLSYIYQRLKLAELIPPAKKEFLSGALTAGHAILIARLQPNDQKDALKNSDVSVRDMADWIRRNVNLDLHSAAFKKDDASLLPKAGPCTTCPKRTGFNKELFQDIVKGDYCTDPGCFNTKQSEFLKRVVTEAEAGAVMISSESWYPERDIKALKLGVTVYRKTDYGGSDGHYREVKPGSCAHTKPAIVVYGKQVGRKTTVCLHNPKCKVHWKRNSYSDSRPKSKTDIAKEKREKAKRERVQLTKETLFDGIHMKATLPFPRKVMEVIVGSVVENAYIEEEKYPEVTKLIARFRKSPSRATEKELAELMIIGVALGEVTRQWSHHPTLGNLATAYGINPKDVQKAVAQKLKLQTSAKGKPVKKGKR